MEYGIWNMITLKQAVEKVKEQGLLACYYTEYEDFWLLGVVSLDTGSQLDLGSIPIIYKKDGSYEAYIFLFNEPKLPEHIISEGIVQEREEYREQFNNFSMEHFGHPYLFPDEKPDDPPLEDDKEEIEEDELPPSAPEKHFLGRVTDKIKSLFD